MWQVAFEWTGNCRALGFNNVANTRYLIVCIKKLWTRTHPHTHTHTPHTHKHTLKTTNVFQMCIRDRCTSDCLCRPTNTADRDVLFVVFLQQTLYAIHFWWGNTLVNMRLSLKRSKTRPTRIATSTTSFSISLYTAFYVTVSLLPNSCSKQILLSRLEEWQAPSKQLLSVVINVLSHISGVTFWQVSPHESVGSIEDDNLWLMNSM